MKYYSELFQGMYLLERLDNSLPSRFHHVLFANVAAAQFFDSFNFQAFTFALPIILVQWSLPIATTGYVGTAVQFGFLLGTLLFGILSDRIGRKSSFQIAIALFGLFVGISTLTSNILEFTIALFLAGIGLGGEIPLSYTLLGEFMPSKHRGRYQAFNSIVWQLGAVTCGIAAYLTLRSYSWQVLFLMGAVPSIILLGPIRRYVPESLRFLLSKGRVESAQEVANKINVNPTQSNLLHDKNLRVEPLRGKLSLRSLLNHRYRRRTFLTWALYFINFITYFGIATWLPTLLVSAGYDIAKSILFTLIMLGAATAGQFAAAIMIDRVGRKPLLTIFSIFAALATGAMGISPVASVSFLIFGSMSFFFVRGVSGVLHAFANESYPTEIRTAGHGIAQGVGRLGGMVGPGIIAIIVITTGSLAASLLFFLCLNLGAAFLLLSLGYETRGKSLETIAGDALP